MTSTGIVRRIHQNGTIVIPKEVRKTLSIEDGDPFEIFIGENNEIILKQYIPEQQTHKTPRSYCVSTKVNLKKLWNYLTDTFEQEEIVAGFANAIENFEYDPATIDDKMIDALPEDKARDLFFNVADMALKELFGRDFVAWHDVLKNRLGFDEKTIGF